MTTGCIRVQGDAREELCLPGRVEAVFTEETAFELSLRGSRGSETFQAVRRVGEKILSCSSLQERTFCGAEKVGDKIKEGDEAQA